MFSLSRTQALTNIITAMPKSSQIPIQTQVSVQGQEGLMFMGGGGVGGWVAGAGEGRRLSILEETPVWYSGLNFK